MKVTPKQYAQALLDVVAGKGEVEVLEVVKDFAKLLKKNNQAAQLEKILYYFTRLHDKQTGIVQSKVITAKALDEELMAEVTNYLNGIEKGEKVEVSFNVNKKILGGLVVKYGDRILDNSLKTRLNQLKTSLLK